MYHIGFGHTRSSVQPSVTCVDNSCMDYSDRGSSVKVIQSLWFEICFSGF